MRPKLHITIFAMAILLLDGCATPPTSASFGVPPEDYRNEVISWVRRNFGTFDVSTLNLPEPAKAYSGGTIWNSTPRWKGYASRFSFDFHQPLDPFDKRYFVALFQDGHLHAVLKIQNVALNLYAENGKLFCGEQLREEKRRAKQESE